MFEKLKHKNPRQSKFENRELRSSFCKSPGATSSVVKGNEADRLVRCRNCGFICDRERDVRLQDQTHAGFGVNLGAAKTATASKGDARVPAAGSISTKADTYYSRDVSGGCPCCGSYLYDPKMPIINVP